MAMASDRARVSYDPSRKWRGLIAQQGRVTLDADWNEASEINAERDRLLTLDFVGPVGTPAAPAAGYIVTAVPAKGGPAGSIPGDLTIGAGALYVGGDRLDLDGPVTYSGQPEWLDYATSSFPAGIPTDSSKGLWVAPGPSPNGVLELVYLLAFEQEVSAVEDPALADVALGGPDTMQRGRIIQRFVRQTVGSLPKDPSGDWWNPLTQSAPAGLFSGLTFDSASMRLQSATTLRVAFSDGGGADGGNAPGTPAGYLGAENQLIRVMVTGSGGDIVWGFDDASFLYRVEATYDSATNTTTLTLASPPVDSFHNPVVGQAAELLRDAVQLTGTDYVASPTGFVSDVTTAYDPTTMTVAIDGQPPADYLTAGASDVSPGPQVTGITPVIGVVGGGTPVTITGIGFTGATGASFGPDNAASGLLVQSDTQLTVVSPPGPAGAVQVTVTTPVATSPTGGADTFTFANPGTPAIAADGIVPAQGALGGGTQVMIAGSGFTGATVVNFGSSPGLGLELVSDRELLVTTPPASAGAVGVAVVTPAGTSPAGPQFTYSASPPPQVTGVSPAAGGVSGGTVVTVSGSGFTGATAVAFGAGNAGTGLAVISDTELTITSPPASASGVVDVIVTTPAGTSPKGAADQFSYQLLVTEVSPNRGPLTGGTVVTVLGSGFTGATEVDFGGVAGTGLMVLSDTQLTVTTPPGTGTVDVTVATPSGTSTTAPGDAFSYELTPQLYLRVWQGRAQAPAAAPAAEQPEVLELAAPRLSILRPILPVSVFTPIRRLTAASRTVSFPLTGTGAEVTLTAADGTFHPGDFWSFALRPSTPTAIYPARYMLSGQPPDGPRAWITALAGLTWQADATDATQLSAQVLSLVPQFWSLPALTQAVIQHVTLPPPVVTALSPANGPPAGGTAVSVTGTGFTGASAVQFGGVPATSLFVLNDTQLVAVSPPGSGQVDLTVITHVGTSATGAPDQFDYVGVTAVSPAVGAPGGGTAVTISGSGFAQATGVTFGTVAGTNMTKVSDSEITVTSPAGSGLVDVHVTTPLGASAASAADRFAYVAVSGAGPLTGPESGGTSVTLTGTGFASAGVVGVQFGANAATSVQVQSDTSIVATSPAGNGSAPLTVVTRMGSISAGPTFVYQGKAAAKDGKDISDKFARDKNVLLDRGGKGAILLERLPAVGGTVFSNPVELPRIEETQGGSFISEAERPAVGEDIAGEEN